MHRQRGREREREREGDRRTRHLTGTDRDTLSEVEARIDNPPGESFSSVKGAEAVTGPANNFICTVSSDFSPTFQLFFCACCHTNAEEENASATTTAGGEITARV